MNTLGVITIPSGSYEEIKFEVEIQPNGNEAAFQLKGNFTNALGLVTPVTLNVNAMIEIDSKQLNLTIVDGNNLTALTTLNLSSLTTGITESMYNAATRTNGAIEISSTSNADIYNIILDNLKNCGGVEVD